jgi:hypothetical protein
LTRRACRVRFQSRQADPARGRREADDHPDPNTPACSSGFRSREAASRGFSEGVIERRLNFAGGGDLLRAAAIY